MLAQSNKNRNDNNHNHRGRLDIIADILEASHEGTRKTYLMYRCNMSFKQLKGYLDFLVNKELLFMVNGTFNPDPSLFKVTNKGKEFLKTYKDLKDLVT